jgi:hypothetical protein
MSAGPDGGRQRGAAHDESVGVFFLTPAGPGTESGAAAKYQLGNNSSDPYIVLQDSQSIDRQRGELMPSSYRLSGLGPDDNIHNHLLDVRR